MFMPALDTVPLPLLQMRSFAAYLAMHSPQQCIALTHASFARGTAVRLCHQAALHSSQGSRRPRPLRHQHVQYQTIASHHPNCLVPLPERPTHGRPHSLADAMHSQHADQLPSICIASAAAVIDTLAAWACVGSQLGPVGWNHRNSTWVRRTSACCRKLAAKLRQRQLKLQPRLRGCITRPSQHSGDSQPFKSTCSPGA